MSTVWGQFISGISAGNVSIKLFWDTSAVYTGATPNLIPGATGAATLKIGNSGKSITAQIVITGVEMTNAPNAAVTWNVEAAFYSNPTFPT